MEELKVVCFRLGEALFAVDIMRVREIIKPILMSALPEAPSFVRGVINLRGSVIPVVDMRARFDLPSVEGGADNRLIIAVVERRPIGFMVDAVVEVASIPVKDIRSPRDVLKSAECRHLIGVCLLGRVTLFLVNPDSVMNSGDIGALPGFNCGLTGTMQCQD
jgi:purine-binding chemotaxis protein CheW